MIPSMMAARLGMLVGILVVGAMAPAAYAARASKPQNVILFLGDGMGISTITAARIFQGQQRGRTGEENSLSFESFPHVALIKTYNVDRQVSDSAGTMTAIMSGKKTRFGFIGIGPGVVRGDCPGSKREVLESLLERAEKAGMQTGIVSTTRITHATPAATYAHVPERNWEADHHVPEIYRELCKDIAVQLVEFPYGDGIDVVLGGGRQMFLPNTEADPEHAQTLGQRTDERNLIQEWLAGGDQRTYVWNEKQFKKLRKSGQVLGLFEASHMNWEADRGKDPGGEPSLADMTKYAIDRLKKSRTGYFLMVEAGRIDHAHHGTNAYRALVDTVALSDAVRVAVRKTKEADTLIVVTADHSHTLTISGYPMRGNPILGYAATYWGESLPNTTLGYANGIVHEPPADVAEPEDTLHPDYRQLAAWKSIPETHAGEDVSAYALGPNSDALHGVMEQNEIYNVLRDALLAR